jgi:hypothetical protein
VAPWPLSVVCLLCSVLESYYPSCEKNFPKTQNQGEKTVSCFEKVLTPSLRYCQSCWVIKPIFCSTFQKHYSISQLSPTAAAVPLALLCTDSAV